MAEGLLELQSVARDASDCGKLSDPRVKDEDPGLIEAGPSGGELVVEHEPLLVVVGTVLGEGGRASDAGCRCHEEVLEMNSDKSFESLSHLTVEPIAYLD